MQRVKRRTFSGVVCEQEVYNVPDRIKSLEKAEPRPRFKNEEERELHRIGISRRKHARLINENYGPTSLYSTLTLDNESEVHTFDEARRIRDLYVRRLKYHAPDAKINIYMGRGKTTFRRLGQHDPPRELAIARGEAGRPRLYQYRPYRPGLHTVPRR